MKVHPYLNFNGNAEEAFLFYRSVFGGEFTANIKMTDAPGAEGLPEEDRKKTMHICLPIGEDTLLMASDCISSAVHTLDLGNQTNILLAPNSREEAERLFKGLSEGGDIEMDLADTFWGSYFGNFTDKFGIRWMIEHSTK
tara:strand:- start:54106 stop:54525 length:420 start_codon:yes stop_codon:yes gene_type:complete